MLGKGLREALCYDYCLAEYPAAGRLPRFFPDSGAALTRDGAGESPAELARRLGIGKGCRVRTFSRRFARDPRLSPDERREVDLLFVYISTPGRGLEVKVLEV